MITNYITINTIIEKLNRFNIPGGYWNIEEIKEWTFDTLNSINTIEDKVEMSCNITITNGKGILPSNVSNIKYILEGETAYPMEETDIGREFNKELQYKIYNGYVYTDFDEGYVIINYLGYPEKDNSPLIPDNNYYIKAVESFIKYKIGERAYWQGKILERQFQMLEQEWLFYLPAAQNSNKLNILKDSNKFRRISNRYYSG
jgi:hypothetical protein